MRKTGRNDRDVPEARGTWLRGVRFAVAAASIAIVLSSGMARAQDDDDE